MERYQEIPNKGAFCDLVWYDPEDIDYISGLRGGILASILAFSDENTKEAKFFKAVTDEHRVFTSKNITPYFL